MQVLHNKILSNVLDISIVSMPTSSENINDDITDFLNQFNFDHINPEQTVHLNMYIVENRVSFAKNVGEMCCTDVQKNPLVAMTRCLSIFKNLKMHVSFVSEILLLVITFFCKIKNGTLCEHVKIFSLQIFVKSLVIKKQNKVILPKLKH